MKSATRLAHITAAFAGNDMAAICKALDVAVQERGIARVATEAKVDRTTLFRAFRQANGPSLDTMVSVLQVLGVRLIVERRKLPKPAQPHSEGSEVARLLTNGFRSGDLDLAIAALAAALRSQNNISEFVRSTDVSRENLYRSFAFPRIPRFQTVLTFLDALGLRFSIEPLSAPANDAHLSRPPRSRMASP